MIALEGARCALHSTSPASGVCDRCGAFVCFNCETLFEGKRYCPNCAKKMVQPLVRGSNQAYAAVVLGVMGLHCMFPLGIVGLVLGFLEEGAINRGESPEAGRGLVKAAKVCGYICVVATVMSAIAIAGAIIASNH